MDIRQLRYFVAIAEEQNFLRASERLRISQPPLSQQIKKLEDEIGGDVFVRNSRGVTLTPVGETLLEDARNIIKATTEARDRAQRVATGHAGKLRVGFVASASFGIIPHLVKTIKDEFGSIDFELVDSSTTEQSEKLRNNMIDIGIVRSPINDAGLDLTSILTEPFQLVVIQEHALANRRKVKLSEIEPFPVVTFPRRSAPAYFDILIYECKKAGFSPRLEYEIEQIKSALDIVASGLAISIQPQSVSQIRTLGLSYIPIADFEHKTEVCAITRANDQNPLVDAARKICSTYSRGSRKSKA